MTYNCFEAQEIVRLKVKNGIPLLLNHCNIDSHNEYMREWAIFAIRNITQNNSKNQDIISKLEKKQKQKQHQHQHQHNSKGFDNCE